MMKIKQLVQKMGELIQRQRILFIGLFSVLLVVVVTTSTLAWQASQQKAVNELTLDREPQEVVLTKYAKDKDNAETIQVIEGTLFTLYEKTPKGDKQIGGFYTTDKKGQIKLSVPPGTYYFEEVTPSPGYTFDQDEKGKVIKQYPFTVTSEDKEKPIQVKAYNRLSKGKLEVSKQVKNADDSPLTEVQKQQVFTFKITFSDKGTYSYQLAGSDTLYSVKSGETFTLTHGQQAIFKEIPEGIQYTLTEVEVPGVISEGSNTSGTIHSKSSQVVFTNTFLETSQLILSKRVISGEGNPLTEAQQTQDFSFVVTFSDKKMVFPYETTKGCKGKLQSGDTVTLVHGEELKIYDLPIGTSYTVTEQATEGYLSGQMYWEGTLLESGPTTLDIVNEVETDITQTNALTFIKQVVIEAEQDDTEFSFEVTFEDNQAYEYQIDGGPIKTHQSGEIIPLKAGQRVTFKDLPVGLMYHIKELEIPHYQGELTEVSGIILSEASAEFTFINHFKEQAHLQVKKVVEGENFKPDELFTFTVYVNGKALDEKVVLKAGETSEPIPLELGDTWRVVEEIGHPDYQQTTITNSVGEVTEANQEVLVTQTNTYRVPPTKVIKGEKQWNIPEGMADKQPESITIHLMADKQVVATQEVKGHDWTYSFEVPQYDSTGKEILYHIEEDPIPGFAMSPVEGSFDIKNTYVVPVQRTPLKVIKQVTGQEPTTPSDFIFQLTPGKEELVITGSGEREFPSVTFDSPGTYHYTIREKQTGILGYTYDDSVYDWTLVVEETEGHLEIVSETLEKNGEPYLEEAPVFENQFEPSLDEKVLIKGTKTWKHGTNPPIYHPKTIVVQLLENGRVVQQKQVSEADKWSYEFVANVYDEEGKEITYKVKESPVPHYKTTVSGYDLRNIFIEETEPTTSGSQPPTTTPTKRPGKLLQTNEKQTLVAVFVGLAIVLGVTVYYSSRVNPKQKSKKRRK